VLFSLVLSDREAIATRVQFASGVLIHIGQEDHAQISVNRMVEKSGPARIWRGHGEDTARTRFSKQTATGGTSKSEIPVYF
jgi:hypothetical protein